MHPLTDHQTAAMRVIHQYWKVNGRSPSTREVATGLHVTDNAAHEVIKVLKKKGHLEDGYDEMRSLYPIGLRKHIQSFDFPDL